MSQFLTLTAVAPAEATLELALSSATYRVTGKVAGQRRFGFHLSPTYTSPFNRVIAAGRDRERLQAVIDAKSWYIKY